VPFPLLSRIFSLESERRCNLEEIKPPIRKPDERNLGNRKPEIGNVGPEEPEVQPGHRKPEKPEPETQDPKRSEPPKY
jgi:hypothetical protein